ncbi:MAG TPA: hypothetical protein PLA18_07375 [Deltaproteobacteria bacterium]|jgi:hypothetical protein|nr:hypothetical protein [Deltaproteobacteria bacterium]
MENIYEKVLSSYGDNIRQLIRAGGITKLSKKTIGKGIIGLALPAAVLLIEDLTNPNGVVLPFLRWLLSRHSKVKIIEMSAKPVRAKGRGASRTRREPTS